MRFGNYEVRTGFIHSIAPCLSGEIATGGGFDYYNYAPSVHNYMMVSRPYPYEPNARPVGWEAKTDGPARSGLFAFAVCVKA